MTIKYRRLLMKAAVCYEVNKPLVIEDVDLDPPGSGEVKVRLAATAISSSDLKLISGDIPAKLPGIIGHECSGYVDEIGEGVTLLKPGDHVVISPVLGESQETGKTSKPHHHNKKGEPIAQLSGLVGGLGEYTIVDQYQLVKIADDMPMDKSALFSGAVITGFRAVVNLAQVRPFQSVAVIGCGSIGFNAIQGAAFCGAHPVIALDIVDERLEIARTLGATDTINTEKVKDLMKTIKAITDGGGVDYAFITKQSIEAINQGSVILGSRGTEIIVCKTIGELFSSKDREIIDERALSGGTVDSTSLQLDIPRYVSLYKAGRLKLDELITGRYSLEQVNEAIESSKRVDSLRNVIIFS
jgi:S-(hydroxymethyl)glutathione dehydrogenase/alcohol dehydrogenase